VALRLASSRDYRILILLGPRAVPIIVEKQKQNSLVALLVDTAEIYDVWTDRRLAPESQAMELLAPQLCRQSVLGIGLESSQPPRLIAFEP